MQEPQNQDAQPVYSKEQIERVMPFIAQIVELVQEMESVIHQGSKREIKCEIKKEQVRQAMKQEDDQVNQGDKKKNKKKKKELKENAYNLFVKEQMGGFKERYPAISNQELFRKIAHYWKDLDEEQKDMYRAQAGNPKKAMKKD